GMVPTSAARSAAPVRATGARAPDRRTPCRPRRAAGEAARRRGVPDGASAPPYRAQSSTDGAHLQCCLAEMTAHPGAGSWLELRDDLASRAVGEPRALDRAAA